MLENNHKKYQENKLSGCTLAQKGIAKVTFVLNHTKNASH